MYPDESALTNGKPSSVHQRSAARSELDELRATCRRQALVIDSLSEAAAALRQGAVALKAENAQLRVDHEYGHGQSRSRSRANGRVDDGDATEVRLALDVQAPGAARSVVADCVGERVPVAMVDDAQLLVSELVTNSLRHSGASAGDGVVVRVELTRSMLRIEVEDPGSGGVIGPRAADAEVGGGFGLNLVQALSELWGVERVAVGGTRVWAQLARA
jgi:anti-sigma regulatory factor (Ser/Thr protein kinase)